MQDERLSRETSQRESHRGAAKENWRGGVEGSGDGADEDGESPADNPVGDIRATVMITRRDILKILLASPIAATVDVEQLLWVPKPIITVPEMPSAPALTRMFLYGSIGWPTWDHQYLQSPNPQEGPFVIELDPRPRKPSRPIVYG